MRARDIKIGMHVEHKTTGRYLGVVVRKGAASVSTQMPDDPSRGHLASFGEIRPHTAPNPG